MKREDFDFNKYLQTGVGVEVGTEYGLFAEAIKYNGEIFCIDIWKDDNIFEQAKQRLFDKKYNLIRKSSKEAVKQFPDKSLDWVYIDAAHDYESVKEDIELWSPKVRDGGVVMGHDYFNGEYKSTQFGVKKAVDELRQELNFLDDFDNNGRNFLSWWYVK